MAAEMLTQRRAGRARIALAFALTAALFARRAGADVGTCLQAHEKGQQLRVSGALRDARARFLTCGADACPATVRSDCLAWAEEVRKMLPSIVVAVVDANGEDIIDVRVTIDGRPSGETLDGRAIPVDPGPHDVEVDSPRIGRITKRVLVREGDRARQVSIRVGPPSPSASAPTGMESDGAAAGAPESSPSLAAPVSTSRAQGPGIWPWVVVGAGGIATASGLLFLVVAPELPVGCDPSTAKCTPLPGEGPAEFEARKTNAGRHAGMTSIAPVLAIPGAVVMVGGVVWYFAARPRASAKATVRAPRVPVMPVPWVTAEGAGASLFASF